ncbi:MAG TPA: hypothetical protein VE052_08015, partial [Gemmatimonadaceae bacterium]|nr:hypothetical protein [Gemmatimonadaceae bacterium]
SFDRVVRRGCFAVLTRADILLRESLRRLRSAQSKYRIDCAGLFMVFTRTDILLSEFPVGALLLRANGVPARNGRSRSVTHCGNMASCYRRRVL